MTTLKAISTEQVKLKITKNSKPLPIVIDPPFSIDKAINEALLRQLGDLATELEREAKEYYRKHGDRFCSSLTLLQLNLSRSDPSLPVHY